MALPCSSDPTDGCDNSAIVTAIATASASNDVLLTAGNVILADILAADLACCIETNANLTTQITLLTAINAKL